MLSSGSVFPFIPRSGRGRRPVKTKQAKRSCGACSNIQLKTPYPASRLALFPFRKHSNPNPTLVGRKAYCFFVVARLDVIEGCLLACVIVSTSPQGRAYLLIASPVAERGPFTLLRINPIISRGLIPVFEAGESD